MEIVLKLHSFILNLSFTTLKAGSIELLTSTLLSKIYIFLISFNRSRLIIMNIVYQGVVLALIAATLWSINAPLIKRYSGGISSIAFNAIRAITATPILLMIILISKVNVKVIPSGIPFIIASSIIGPGIGDIAYIASIRRIGAGRAITVGYTYVFISQILAALLLGEKLTVKLVAGTLLSILGIYLIFIENSGGGIRFRSSIISLIPVFAWGIGSVVNKLALHYTDPISLGFIRVLILSLLLTSITRREFIRGIRVKRILLSAIITGFTGYGVGIPLFLYAISMSGVSISVLVTTLTPVLGRILSMVVAGERINIKGFIGTLTVILGIIIGTYQF